MIAAIDGNILFLLIAAAIGVINWLSNRKEQKAAKPTETSEKPVRPDPGRESEEERMRRFLEALGVPQGQAPPRPVPPRPAPPAPKPLPKIAPR